MTDQEYNAILDKLEAQMVAQYLEQASKMTGDLSLSQITDLIKAGDDLMVARQFAVSNVAMLETVRQAYLSGGGSAVSDLSKAELSRVKSAVGRIPDFDPRTQSADAWLKARASEFAQTMARQQGDAIQAVLWAGRQAQVPPKDLAGQLLGKSQINGIRAGGVAGLSEADATAVAKARAQLTSMSKGDISAYLTRVRRDRRFDPTIKKALREERLLSQATIDKIIGRYAERLLKTRAEAVAATEVVQAYNAGRNEFYNQLVADGIDPKAITKRWKTRADEKVRAAHRAMNGQVKQGNAPFVAPGGARLMNPGDLSLGAPLSLVMRCRCRSIFKISE